MKEFDENAVCPKCGHDDVTTWYHNPIHFMYRCYETKEHLHRGCARCGYSWLEECLDVTGYRIRQRAFKKWRRAVAVWARSRTQEDKNALEEAKAECLESFHANGDTGTQRTGDQDDSGANININQGGPNYPI